ncbi:MAG: hypothetical protein Ta2B_07940 [Termitinemataceae bacterium]|nr:MAG: hypothetical protein Ta2B_07940 [Termitinemataceae bacterium]
MGVKKVAVIGAGTMGLTCAYELTKQGYHVEVFEKENEIGGMSAHFNFGTLSIEKYNHAVYGPDYALFDLLKELGIYKTLHWTDTKMGYFSDGKLYDWGPVELLKFPLANILEKVRYGAHVFWTSKIKNWKKIDNISAIDWIEKWEGKTAYQKFWASLFDLKFYDKKNLVGVYFAMNMHNH